MGAGGWQFFVVFFLMPLGVAVYKRANPLCVVYSQRGHEECRREG